MYTPAEVTYKIDTLRRKINSLFTRLTTLETSGGGGTTNAIILVSPNSTKWQLSINNAGAIITTQVSSGTATPITFHSPDNSEWQVTINNSGALITTKI